MRAIGSSDLSVFPLCLGGNIFGWTIELARLQTDRIDLYYAHIDDSRTPLADTLAAFGELIRAGKVRYVAASNYDAPRLAEALELARSSDLPAQTSRSSPTTTHRRGGHGIAAAGSSARIPRRARPRRPGGARRARGEPRHDRRRGRAGLAGGAADGRSADRQRAHAEQLAELLPDGRSRPR